MICKLYIRMKIRKNTVEEQVHWILMYIQEGLTDMWKENILVDLELENWKFVLVRELLVALKREFERKVNKLTKVMELKQLKQDF